MTTSRTDQTNVTRFEVPQAAGARIRITVSDPLHFEGWAAARNGAVAVKHTIEIVKGHIRLPTHLPLHAYRESGGVRVTADFESRGGVEPKQWSKLLKCSDITLLGPESSGDPLADVKLLVSGTVRLFDAPGGQTVGAVTGDGSREIWLQERREDWLRVFGTTPFEFDAWVRSADTHEREPLDFVGGFVDQCSHAAAAALPLLLEARAEAVAVAELPPGGQLRVDDKQSSGDFVAIFVPGVTPANKQRRFFVNRQLFERAASRLK